MSIVPKVRLISYAWSDGVESIVKQQCEGKVLHLCSGRSPVGEVRIDLIIWKKYRARFSKANMLASADQVPFQDSTFDTIVADPIYKDLEPPFIKEIVRVLKSGGKLIYYYPCVPYHKALVLSKLYVYPNVGKKYLRFLSIHLNSKLSL